VLDSMDREYKPCQIKTYVDDLPQMHTGPADIIADQAVVQAAALVQKLESEGFTISTKSNIVASTKELAEQVTTRLRQ